MPMVKVFGKKMNPNIEVELRKYKKSPEDTCLEVLKFKK